MPILDHLGELRRRLTIVVIAILLGSVIIYVATPTIIGFLIAPIKEFLPEGANGEGALTVTTSLGGFTARFKVAFFVSIIVCAPLIIWEFMAFFLPALTKKERRWVVPTVAAMIILFFIGVAFCYAVILRAAFGWLIAQTTDGFGIGNFLADAEDYIGIILLLEIGFGFAFQLPLLIFYLSVLHIVPYKVFRENWRYVYVGLLCLSAVVTPDASPVTMLLMFGALLALYELALAISRYILIARDGKESLKWTREQYQDYKASLDD